VAPRSSSSATARREGRFVARAKELAAKYGDRFNPPASLL
jgi:3-hydroxyacyl-CoA dehydrogenase/enoyl-CoA hydratase/3-hydroxybutyryl-CoA epimerase